MTNRLYRSRTDKVLAGVCGGVAAHLGVDPVLVRLIYILLTCATGLGPGIVVYIIAWVIIPEGPNAETIVEPEKGADDPTEV